jgi:hypothetical protein
VPPASQFLPLPPVPPAPSAASEDYTLEQAQAAQSRCSKCRFRGCAQCLRQYHVPHKLLRQWSRESGGSDAQ